jgi:hypothetical protein
MREMSVDLSIASFCETAMADFFAAESSDAKGTRQMAVVF